MKGLKSLAQLKSNLNQIIETGYMNMKTDEMFDILYFLNQQQDTQSEFPPCLVELK